jgi:hypothetical protein
MKHVQYLSYVVRHKLFVLAECVRAGLVVRGLIHDWHKFLPSEWFPYVEHFYGANSGGIATGRDETGYYKPTDTGDAAFDFAWLLHQKRADHHWQWWVLPEDDGGLKVIEMREDARLEMVCDWIGASMAQGHGGIEGVRWWFVQNNGKMQLGPKTRLWIEDYLGIAIDLGTGQVFRVSAEGTHTLYKRGD